MISTDLKSQNGHFWDQCRPPTVKLLISSSLCQSLPSHITISTYLNLHLYLVQSIVFKGEDYHKIPMENFENADSNYRGLWIQLENFVNPNGEKPEYPPLYCLVGIGVYFLVCSTEYIILYSLFLLHWKIDNQISSLFLAHLGAKAQVRFSYQDLSIVSCRCYWHRCCILFKFSSTKPISTKPGTKHHQLKYN